MVTELKKPNFLWIYIGFILGWNIALKYVGYTMSSSEEGKLFLSTLAVSVLWGWIESSFREQTEEVDNESLDNRERKKLFYLLLKKYNTSEEDGLVLILPNQDQ